MTTSLNKQIELTDKLIEKSIDKVNFKEIISLIFHAIELFANDSNNPNQSKWASIWIQFLLEYDKQNILIWPQMITNKNDFAKRIDCILLNNFIDSENILTMLFRLLYIENNKISHSNHNPHYHKIMSHHINNNSDKKIKNLSIYELFVILIEYINYYICIYNTHSSVEYSIGKKILKLVNK